MADVLVVEDEMILALQIEMYLQDWNHRVVGICRSGKDALAHVKDDKPDIVLMDIVLQGELNGIETTRLINGMSSCAVLYMTAYSDSHTQTKADLTRHVGFIPKPLNFEILKNHLDELIQSC